MHMPIFQRYVGIDYSGAASASTPLRGLRLFMAEGEQSPQEILPASNDAASWSRERLALWLDALLSENVPAIVGIDHGFSFPLAYFDHYGLAHVWDDFLDDFCEHWPLDHAGVTVEAIRHSKTGKGVLRSGSARWRRMTEIRCRAKSVFHFDVPGSVAKSTHTGLPWLRYLRCRHVNAGRLQCWPMDGWQVPTGSSVMLEAYPSLYRLDFPAPHLGQDQQDAYAIAAWLQREDGMFRLHDALEGGLLTYDEKRLGVIEGWILGC